jgi:hypothetical protein
MAYKYSMWYVIVPCYIVLGWFTLHEICVNSAMECAVMQGMVKADFCVSRII